MPILTTEQDVSHELPNLPASVRCVLKEAARLGLIPSATRLFMVPRLDPTIEEMTDFMHRLTAQRMTACADQGVPEQGLLAMRNSCIVAFGKACEAALLTFEKRKRSGQAKIDIMLDPRRCEMPDLSDIAFVPTPTPEISKFLATFWSEFDSDTTLNKDDLRQIGANSGFGACLFFAHRDYMFKAHEENMLTEAETQVEIRATLEYVFRVGISFTLQHTLKVLDNADRTIKLERAGDSTNKIKNRRPNGRCRMKPSEPASADPQKQLEHADWLQECQAFLHRPDVLEAALPIAKGILERKNGDVICVTGDADTFKLTYLTGEELSVLLMSCPSDMLASVTETLEGRDDRREVPVLFMDEARGKWAAMTLDVLQMEDYMCNDG